MKFSIKDFFALTKEIRNKKLHFLCSKVFNNIIICIQFIDV